VLREREVHIALRYSMTMGSCTLNEIVYQLKEIEDQLLLQVLGAILDDLDRAIVERLNRTDKFPSTKRKGLGRHRVKGDADGHLCRGRKAVRRGMRHHPRRIKTCFGTLVQSVHVVQCRRCGAQYSPLLNALGLDPYARRETNLEREVIEAVIDTNYRRLIDGRLIDISLGSVHNLVVGSDIDKVLEAAVPLERITGLLADGTGVKQSRGKRGELRAVIGVTTEGRVLPVGTYVNQSWKEIEVNVRRRMRRGGAAPEATGPPLPFVFDGEPGLDDFLAGVVSVGRCVWHGPRGLYHALWEDDQRKASITPQQQKLRQLIGIELPEGSYELLADEDKEEVRKRLTASRAELDQMIATFDTRGYASGAQYLRGLARHIFNHVEHWLATGVIAPRTTSLLERVFREIGRRLKRIAWGWSDKGAANVSKMIVIRQYDRETWDAYWKKKLGIHGVFTIGIAAVTVAPCQSG